MDSLFHFVFAFIAGMAVTTRLDYEPFQVGAVALLAVLIDIDHVLFLAGLLPYPRTFHSLFVTAVLPVLLFYAAYRYERGTESIHYQRLALLLTVMLLGHVVADLFNEGGIRLLYPVVSTVFRIPSTWQVSLLRDSWHILSPDGIGLLLYGVVISVAHYTEDFIYFFEKQHETVTSAASDALSAEIR